MTGIGLRRVALCGVAYTTLGLATTATAQSTKPIEATSSATPLEEVVVTAQRHSERLLDVGIAVTAANGADLKARGVTSSSDIVRLMPGVNVSGTFGGQGLQFSIRGVTQSDYNDAIEPPIAVYIDDVYVASQQGQGMALYDLARVEALKGPQGTLFGRNATGGLIQFVVNKPSLEARSGYVDATYGRFDRTVLEGAVNLPVGDHFAIRASGFWDRHDAIWNNVHPAGMAPGAPLTFGAPGPSPAGEDLGGENTRAGRLQLLWSPSANVDVRLTGSTLKQTMSASPWTESAVVPQLDAQGHEVGEIYAGPNETRAAIGPDGHNLFNPAQLPFQSFLFSPNNDGQRAPGADWYGYTAVSAKDRKLSDVLARSKVNTFDADNLALHIDTDLGGVQFASVTAWSRYKKHFMLGDGAPVQSVGFGAKSKTETFSQEARLSGGTEGLTWTAGIYYLHIDANNAQGLLATRGSALAAVFGMPAVGVDPLSVFTLRTNSGSLFGQVGWDFQPKWRLVAGVRGVYERQRYDFASFAFQNIDDYSVDTSSALFPLLPGFKDRRTAQLWAGKVQLEYRPSDGLLIYAGVNRGAKAGSYNGQVFSGDPPISPAQIPYKPETLVSVEGGVKLAPPGARYTIAATAYRYFYQHYQSFVFSQLTGFVQNRNADTVGAEIETAVKLADSLTLRLSGAYVDATVKDVEVSPGVFVDTQPTYTPRYAGSVSLTYRVPQDVLGGQMDLAASVSAQSSFYHNARNFAGQQFNGYSLVDLNANWTGSSGFSVSGFVKNLADERYKTVGLDLSTVCGCNIEAYGMPRTFGITLRQTF